MEDYLGKRIKIHNRMFMDAEHSFSLLKFYYNEVIDLLHIRAADFHKFTDQVEKDYKKRQRSFDKENWLKHYDVFSGYYPNIFSNSFIISACALFEFHIRKICDLVKEEHKVPLEWDDMRGSVPVRAKSYLWHSGMMLKDDPLCSFQHWYSRNMPGEKNVTVNELWRDVENYFRVRNCIAHHGGSISKMRNRKYVTRFASAKGIIIENNKQQELKLSHDFNREVCETMMKFFSRLQGAYYSLPLPED
ncbi:hypothetical protein ACFLUJ_02140 [Chloroflexota bacterium]